MNMIENTQKPITVFAVCDSRPSEQITGNPEQLHTIGIITFPNEGHVEKFIKIVEQKVSEKLGKVFNLDHWKKYRNTDRGKKKKGALLESILESVAESPSVSIWALMEKEKSIIDNQDKYIKNFNLQSVAICGNDEYILGPFSLIKKKNNVETPVKNGVSINQKAGAALIWCAVSILRLYNTMVKSCEVHYPGRKLILDLRYDLLPNDNIETLERITSLMGLLIHSSKGNITPVINPENKRHPSDILADNVAGMFAEWDIFVKENGYPHNAEEVYGHSKGVYHFYIE
jgi:hypothetical protein